MSADPAGYTDSSNLYAYCGGDPINCSDPTGLWGLKDAWETTKSVGGYVVGVVESGVKTAAHGAAMTLTNATNSVVDVYTNTRIAVSAYQSGGIEAVKREAEIVSAQQGAEAKENLLSLIPFRNTIRQGAQVVDAYEEGSFEGGRQVGRTTFSLGTDVATVYAGIKTGQAIASKFRGTPPPVTPVEPTVEPPAASPTRRMPEIPNGSSGGVGAGKRIPQSLRDQWFPESEPAPACAYCRMNDANPLDHVIPRVQGGDLTPENITPACTWCNSSKGARVAPVNPPPGYTGEWPPAWWPERMQQWWRQSYGGPTQ